LQIPNAHVSAPFRTGVGQRQVLDVKALVDNVTTGLKQAYGNDQAPPVTPGAFGIEMVVGAERVPFYNAANEAPVRAPAEEKHTPPPGSVRALLEGLGNGR
jgi:hypothetical protein